MYNDIENSEKLQNQIEILQIEKQTILDKLTATENELVEIKAENELLNKSLVSIKEELKLRNLIVAANQISKDKTNRLKCENELLNKTIHELQLNCEELKQECHNESLEKLSLRKLLENRPEDHEMKQLQISNKKLQTEIKNKISEHVTFVENSERLVEVENLRRLELQAKNVNLEIENATLISHLQVYTKTMFFFFYFLSFYRVSHGDRPLEVSGELDIIEILKLVFRYNWDLSA